MSTPMLKCDHCGRDHIPHDAPRTAKYRRISDDREGRELGIERQDEDMNEFACRNDLRIVASFWDNDIGASTRSRKPRPGYEELMVAAERQALDVILAYTSSRLTRRTMEHERQITLAEKYGIRFRYLRSPDYDLNTASGRMIARVMAARDAAESEEIGERVARARRQQAEQGRNGGGIRRFGWEPDGVTVREDEAAIIAELADKVLAGATLNALARMLRERDVTTVGKRKRPWMADDVSRLVTNPCNAGLRTHQGELIPSAESWWNRPERPGEPIIDRETWDAVRVKLADPGRKTSPGNKPRWFGSGLYVCGHPRCESTGHTMTVSYKKRNRLEESYPAYRCRELGHATREATWLDAYVADVIIERLSRPDAIELLRAEATEDTSGLSRRLSAIREQIAEAKELWQAGIFSSAELKTRVSRLNDDAAEIEARLNATTGADPLAGIAGRPDVRQVWDGLDLAARRAIMSALMTVTVLPAPRGRMSDERKQEFVQIAWK